MNKLLRFLTPLFALACLAFLALNVKYMLSNPFVSAGKQERAARGYHFDFFLPEADYSFFKDLKDGAIDAARVTDCAISFHPIDLDPLSLEMARFTGIDGLAVYPYLKDSSLVASLEKIYDAGIPLVQIENLALNKPKAVFIGTNSFDCGKAIGRLTLQSDNRDLNIALVYSDKNPGLMADANLLEMGIKSILGRRISSMRSFHTSQNPLDADRLASELVREGGGFNLVVFTDANDTIVAVQAIIDMNAVGRTQVIGFGNDPAIKDYVAKGIVLGSVVRDPYHIGFNAVLALSEIKKSGNTSAFVDTGISVLDRANVSEPKYGMGP